MRENREINGHTVTFFVGSSELRSQPQNIRQKIDRWVQLLGNAPSEHIALIVPILIVDRFPGSRVTGSGWFPPRNVASWRRPQSILNTGIDTTTLGQLDIVRGIIGVTKAATETSYWELSPLHEFGHCVDYHSAPNHLGLIPRHRTRDNNPAWRQGNAPYQGQRYTSCTGLWDLRCMRERAAETYSRFLATTNRICRGIGNRGGTPPCLHHSVRGCNIRLMRDLRDSPAFSSIPTFQFPIDISFSHDQGMIQSEEIPITPSGPRLASEEQLRGVVEDYQRVHGLRLRMPGPNGLDPEDALRRVLESERRQWLSSQDQNQLREMLQTRGPRGI